MSRPLRFGVQTATERTSWAELSRTWRLVEELGYDTAWTFDHFIPIFAGPTDPCLEGWISLAALAAQSTRSRVGVLVTGNTYRHPAVLAKMGATLDHTCGGRLVMGLGAGWYALEHKAYGIPFPSPGERVRRLDEAAEIIRRLWTERKVTFSGRYYQLTDAVFEPKPLQKPHPPILIGGGGEKLTLRAVAKHADIWNTFGSPEIFRHKLGVLRGHCEAVGRPMEEIEISWAGTVSITESKTEKSELLESLADRFGRSPEEIDAGYLVGSPSEVGEKMERFMEVGVTHFIGSFVAPFPDVTIRRWAEEVISPFRR